MQAITRTRNKISVAIKTMNRKPTGGINYLGDTLQNLVRGGIFKSDILSSLAIVDSGSQDIKEFWGEETAKADLPDYVYIDYDDDKIRTLHQNAARAIRIASQDLDATWCLVLEDDIDVCSNFLESVLSWLESHASPSHRMYAFGANYSQIKSAVEQGDSYWLYPVSAFYGAQSLAWHREDAIHLADWLGDDPSFNGVKNHGHDLLLQKWAQSLDITYFKASAPSFVQHIGRQSGIGNRFFSFDSFPGREWSYV